jgi:hypothetical protein
MEEYSDSVNLDGFFCGKRAGSGGNSECTHIITHYNLNHLTLFWYPGVVVWPNLVHNIFLPDGSVNHEQGCRGPNMEVRLMFLLSNCNVLLTTMYHSVAV